MCLLRKALKHEPLAQILMMISSYADHVFVICSMARVAHSGMTADEIVENVLAAVSTISTKLEMVSGVEALFT